MDQFSPQALQQGNTYTQAVKDRLAELLRAGGNVLSNPAAPNQAQAMPQMGGMAGQAQSTLQNLPYQRYVQEMQAQGMQPLPPELWGR